MPKSRFSQFLTDTAGALGGRNETNVANTSDEPIRVTVSHAEHKVEKVTVEADPNSPKVTVEIEKNENAQSVIIQPGESHRFDRENARDHMTIEKLDSNSVPVENMPIPTNESYIVTDKGLERQDYGNPNLCVDEYGNDHSK